MSVAWVDPAQLRHAADPARGDRIAGSLFIHLGLIACLCLQRFCIYVGDSPVYVCLPIFLALLSWLMITGRADFRTWPLTLYLGFAAVALAATLIAINTPDPRISGLSVASLLSVLVLYAGLTLGPTARFDGRQGFAIFMFYVRLCAVLGIAQYLAQYAGFRLFSFMAAVPALKPILVEPLFNHTPVVSYGSNILRSNGFFLVEPSTFSQLLMLGVVVDVFIRARWRWLPVYGAAYLFTYAGTGLLALALAFGLYLLTLPRDSPRLLGFAALGIVGAGVAALVFPEQFGALGGRAGELGATGSSGYARYATQFDVIGNVWGETRTLLGFGPGALERAIFHVPGGGNPALKLFIDYGVLGLASFVAFFVATLWRRDIALVSLFVFVNFQLGGGNLLFAPLVVLAVLLCVWCRPQPTGA